MISMLYNTFSFSNTCIQFCCNHCITSLPFVIFQNLMNEWAYPAPELVCVALAISAVAFFFYAFLAAGGRWPRVTGPLPVRTNPAAVLDPVETVHTVVGWGSTAVLWHLLSSSDDCILIHCSLFFFLKNVYLWSSEFRFHLFYAMFCLLSKIS